MPLCKLRTGYRSLPTPRRSAIMEVPHPAGLANACTLATLSSRLAPSQAVDTQSNFRQSGTVLRLVSSVAL
ncbi:hypothetical protein BU23DRAFT_553585 [Bimuria novae-zelandiae CBS 107.79]|uniref:Uncharacterized protein n=1 Tax=Bimuria novae-zelandiae CBS 107.79 TaxID=1447943 RepID=A0A6A5VCX5_9PLEO|nr:hypothetical protein BU23DRAFT_553585 [Bimuria novae-zelandiae CBS 107.79]